MDSIPLIAGLLLALFSVLVFRRRVGGGRNVQIPALIYHRLARDGEELQGRDKQDLGSVLYESEFSDQLREMERAGYEFISVGQFMDFRDGRGPLPDKPVLITFDDGWKSVYELAFPILIRNSAVATVFINTDPENQNFRASAPIDEPMTRDMIREMHAAGISIGSHGHSHEWLTACDDDRLKFELCESKQLLEEITGSPVVSFAAPGGKFDSRVTTAAEGCGYRTFFVSKFGLIRSGSDMMELPRIQVQRGTSGAMLVADLRPISIFLNGFISNLKLLPERMLGIRRASAIRHFFLRHGLGSVLSVRFLKRAFLLLLSASIAIVAIAVAT